MLDPQLEDAFGWLAIAAAFLLLSGWYTGFYVHLFSALRPQVGKRVPADTLQRLRFVQSEAQPVAAPPPVDAVGRGVVYVVQMWSTWTGQEHVEDLNNLFARFAPRGVAFVCVTKEAPPKVAAWLSDDAIGRRIRSVGNACRGCAQAMLLAKSRVKFVFSFS